MAFFTVLNQVLVLFLLMGAGYALAKLGMIDSRGTDQMTSLLCYVISPGVILYAFQMRFTPSMFDNFLIASAAAAGIHFFNIAVAHSAFNKKTVSDPNRRGEMRFASVYSNCGFMGFPLLQTLAGTNGLFYGSAYNGVFNLFSWTHGMLLYTGRIDRRSILKAVVNPNVIAVVVGVLFYRFSVALPGPLYSAVGYIAQLNTPLSMIVIGTTITKIPLRSIFAGRLLWAGAAMRNLVLPFALLFLLHAVGLRGELLLCSLIPAACPVAGVSVLYSKLTGKDVVFPAKLMTLSTLFSLVTMPAVVSAITALKY